MSDDSEAMRMLFDGMVYRTRHAHWAVVHDGRTYTSHRRRSLFRTWLRLVNRARKDAERKE